MLYINPINPEQHIDGLAGSISWVLVARALLNNVDKVRAIV